MNKKWNYKKIGEVFTTYSGGTPLKSHKDYYFGGSIPWLLSGEVNQRRIAETKNFITKKGYENSSAKMFPKNTVLVAMYGATAGQVGILDFEAATNQAVCGILPNENVIPEFLYFYMLSTKKQLISQAVGNAQPNLSQLKIKNTHIPIPPLPEQQRIVDILDQSFAAIDQAIENTEKNFKNSNELFQSFLQSVFNPQQNGWKQKNLGEFCKLNGRIGWKGLTAKEYTNSGPLFLSVHSLNYGDYVDFSDAYHISEFRYLESPEIMLKKDDVLICKDGAGIGKCGIVGELPDKTTINSSLLLIRPDKSIHPKFLYYCLISPFFQSIVNSRLNGATTPHLYQRDITEFPIFLPPIETQMAILAKLDSLNEKTKLMKIYYEEKNKKLTELKQSILHKAFQGDL